MRSFLSVTVLALSLAVLPATTNAAPAPAARAATGLVVKSGSWGALKLGMTHTQAQKTGMVTSKADRCAPGYQMAKKYQGRGFVVWKGTYPKMSVRQIVITGAKEHTPKNAHIGSTLRQLRATYPGLSKVTSASALAGEPQEHDDLYVATLTKPHVGTLNFQFRYGPRPTSSSKVTTIVIASGRTVFWGC